MKFCYISTICILILPILVNAACIKKQEQCIDGPATKIIDGFEVLKDCWRYKTRYECTSSKEDTCDELREKDCYEIESVCIETIANKCVRNKKNFHCDRYKKVLVEEERYRYKNQNIQSVGRSDCITEIPCADGSCADKSYESNDEMLKSVSQLQIFKEMQKQIQDSLGEIFKGEDSRCGKAILGWKECCVKGGGWGTSIKFDNCKSEDLETAKKNAAGLCHEVGSYCSKRIAGICRVKKKSFCCFGSKLIRIIHEQARSQLGFGWGNPKSPNCNGLTPDQISKLDFAKLDLSEIYQDLIRNYKTPNTQQLAKDIEKEISLAIENMDSKGESATSPIIKNNKEGAL